MARLLSRRALMAATIGFAAAPSAHATTTVKSLSFGLTPVFLDSDIKLLADLEAFLENKLERPVALTKKRTYQEITALLLSGELDAAWICGFPFIQHRERLSVVASPIYKGNPLYQSYLIVPKNRKIKDWTELRGDVHAFSDPDSNSGYLVTSALLVEHGLSPQTFFRESFFTYGHRNVIRAVAADLAQSGSVDGYVWDVMREREPDLVSRTHVLRRSELLGFPPIACLRNNRQSEGIAALATALEQMPRSQDGQDLLAMLQLDGFKQVNEGIYDGIAAKYELLKGQGL